MYHVVPQKCSRSAKKNLTDVRCEIATIRHQSSIMNNEELTKFSGVHLLYELKMFWWLTGAISYMDGYMYDALLESWVVHLRNLINFFCRPRDRDDVIAEDFFDNPSAWSQSESGTLKNARVRADKELSHITEKRKYAGEKDKDWDVAGLFREIVDIARRFASQASEAKLHSDVKQLLGADPSEVMIVLRGVSLSTGTVSRPLVLVNPAFDKDTHR
jgi:hypothetical protein